MKRDMFRSVLLQAVIVFAVSLVFSNAVFAEEQKTDRRVDINVATMNELSAVSGIGEKKAEAIIAYRTENGAFATIDDIKKVKGIGEKSFEKLKDQITVDGG